MELVDIFEEKAPEVLTDLAKHIEVALEEKCQFSPKRQSKSVLILPNKWLKTGVAR